MTAAAEWEVRECGTCHQVRPVAALVQSGDAWRCAEPCRNPGGRPAVGPPVLIRMSADQRAGIEELGRDGESLAATARRLLADAVAAEVGGPLVMLAEDKGRGQAYVVVGPVRAEELREVITLIDAQPGLSAIGPVRIFSKSQLADATGYRNDGPGGAR